MLERVRDAICNINSFFSYLKVEVGDDVSSTIIPMIIHNERIQFGSSSLWIKERLEEEG